MSDRPQIPGGMKRELRQEAYFGCVKCGCPIIEYHHIEPWSKVKKHEKSNLVVLCPVCHHEANTGAIYQEKVREYKKNPVNKTLRYVQRDFMLRNLDDIVLQLGNVQIVHARDVLQVLGCKAIFFNKADDGTALLNATFFDDGMRIIATIRDNEWKTFISEDMWDINYSPGHLKINLKRNRIFLELTAKENYVKIKMDINILGNRITANDNGLLINGSVLSNITLDGGGIRIG